MTYKRTILVIFVVLFFLPYLSYAQRPQDLTPDQRTVVKPGLSAEYFDLTIGWDDNVNTSKLKSYLFNTNTEISLFDGFSLHLILGFSVSNFNNLIFRKLPFSLELGVRDITGLLVGSEFNKRLFYISTFEINLHGQFVYYYGFANEWEMPDLNVDGTVTGTPAWMRAQIGPTIHYEGLNFIYPFFSVFASKLWGTFSMDQDIKNLFGTEEKKITGKNNLLFTIGSEFGITPNFFVTGALAFMPYKGGIDFSGMISIQYVIKTQNRRTL